MKTNEIVNGLLHLGYEGGWVVSGDEIVLWENSESQPTMQEIKQAADNYVQPKPTIQNKLQALGLDEDDLKALGL
jgi:MOSC domain-containing protein YiiM